VLLAVVLLAVVLLAVVLLAVVPLVVVLAYSLRVGQLLQLPSLTV